MFTFLTFATLVLTLTRVTTGYEELIGLPEEVYGESNHLVDLWDLKDNDIWDENPKSTKQEPENSQALLETLCENYDFAIDDRIIDCKNLRLVEKSLKVPAEHLLRKRELEAIDEGSGDGEEHPAAEHDQEEGQKKIHETSTEHTGHENVGTEHSYPAEQLNNYQTANVVDAAEKIHETSEHSEHEIVVTEHSEPAEHLNNYQSANVVDVHAPDAEKGDYSGHVKKNDKLVEMKPQEKTEEKVTEQTLHQQKSGTHSGVEQTTSKSKTLVEEIPKDAKKIDETTTENIPEGKLVEEPKAEERPVSGVPVEQQTPEQKATTQHAEVKSEEKSSQVTLGDNPADVFTSPQPSKEETPQKPVEQTPVVDQDLETTKTANTNVQTVQPTPVSVAPKESQVEKEQDKSDKSSATEDKDSKTNVVSEVKPAEGEAKEQSKSEGIIKKGRKSLETADESANETETKSAAVGEAKESVSQKDTKILLGLFGAVVGMGAAAFVYNQIRKKKRANAPRNSSNGVKKDDPEEGKEMKPLITNGENKKATVVDFEAER